MGEAKRRGSFEERKIKAVELKEIKEAEYEEKVKEIDNTPISPVALEILTTALMLQGSPWTESLHRSRRVRRR